METPNSEEIEKYVLMSVSENVESDIKSLNDEQLYKFKNFLNYYIKLKHITSERKNHINRIIKLIENEIFSRQALQESDISLRPTIELQLDNDGNMLLIKREHVDFETIYANSHELLKIYEKSNNIEGMKYELCKQWMCKTLIDYKLIYPKGIKSKLVTAKQRKQAVTLKSFIMNDMKKYLEIINKEESNFNFQEYFNKTQFGIEIYKIDNRAIKASKMILGAFK